jgi:hypothetical protein
MQIVAHSTTLQSTKDFLFCAHGYDLMRREATLRANFDPHDSPRRSASFTRTLAEVLRKRHRHLSCCSVCILREIFNGGLPQ